MHHCRYGVGTAHYDPRPAVIAFLNKKERRYIVNLICPLISLISIVTSLISFSEKKNHFSH